MRGLSPGEYPNLILFPPKCLEPYLYPRALKTVTLIESHQWEATALCSLEDYPDCVAMAILPECIVILATLLIAGHNADGQYKVIC